VRLSRTSVRQSISPPAPSTPSPAPAAVRLSRTSVRQSISPPAPSTPSPAPAAVRLSNVRLSNAHLIEEEESVLPDHLLADDSTQVALFGAVSSDRWRQAGRQVAAARHVSGLSTPPQAEAVRRSAVQSSHQLNEALRVSRRASTHVLAEAPMQLSARPRGSIALEPDESLLPPRVSSTPLVTPHASVGLTRRGSLSVSAGGDSTSPARRSSVSPARRDSVLEESARISQRGLRRGSVTGSRRSKRSNGNDEVVRVRI
jgi:hypothetical protein